MSYGRQRAGYSLIELVLVVTIISLIATLAFVNLDSLLPEAQLGSTTRDVAALIRLARHDASITGKRAEIVYELGSTSAVRFGQETLTLGQPAQITAIAFANGEQFTAGEVRLQVESSGRTLAHTVTIEGEGGKRLTIHVAGVTGLVTVHDGTHELPQPSADKPVK